MKKQLDFKTTKEYPIEDIKKVQKRLLEMADIILKILDDNGIKYMMSYGTLIGAVRHKGFIPWDDDFDVFLFGEEYDKALKVLRENLPEDIIVHDKENDPIYWPYWSRIRDTHSEVYSKLFPNDNKYKYRGINFDIYRIDKIKKKDAEKLRYFHYLTYQDRVYKSGLISYKEKICKKLSLYPKYFKASLKSMFSSDNEEVYWFILGYYDGVDKDTIFPLKKYEFEGRKFYGPNDADKMLRQRFGDYMEIPKYEDRKAHYTWVKFY